MPDIVTELRERALLLDRESPPMGVKRGSLERRAAEEIERLRKELSQHRCNDQRLPE